MSFTLQSTKLRAHNNHFIKLAVFLLIFSFLILQVSVAEYGQDYNFNKLTLFCNELCNNNNIQKNMFYCAVTHTIDNDDINTPFLCEASCINVDKTCNLRFEDVCLQYDINNNYQNLPFFKYDETCYADFAFLKYNLKQEDVSDLFLKFDSLTQDKLIELFQYSSLSDAWFGDGISINRQILMDNLNLLQSKTLNELSMISSSRLFQSAAQADNDALTSILNMYISPVASGLNGPFDKNFYCLDINICSIKGSPDNFILNLKGMELPLGQFKTSTTLKDGVSITYDSDNSMLKIMSVIRGQNIKNIYCGTKNIDVILNVKGSSFECGTLNGIPTAILNPGAAMDYEGYLINNNGADGFKVYWGSYNGQEGIVIDETNGIKFYFNNVQGVTITKGCAKIIVDDQGQNSDSIETCISAGNGRVYKCIPQQDFNFECSNGIKGNASEKCIITENLPEIIQDPELDNYCYDLGLSKEVSSGECPCDVPGSMLASTECAEAVGLTAEEDMTIAEIKELYPSCTICPSSEGMGQHVCDRLVNAIMGDSGKSREDVLGDPASQKRIKTEVLKIIDTCKAGGTTGCKGALEGEALGAGEGAGEDAWKKLCDLPDSENLGAMGDLFEFNKELFTGSRTRGEHNLAIYNLKPGDSCFTKDYEVDPREAVANFAVLNNKLYIGSENIAGVLRQDSPGKWSDVHKMGEGSSFAVVNFGNKLYLGTGKYIGTGNPAQIWKSYDGSSWQKISESSDSTYYDAENFNNMIYFIGLKTDSGSRAWLFDGSKITKEIELDGGDSYGWSGEVIGDYLYIGVRHLGSIFRIDKSGNAEKVFSGGTNVHRIAGLPNEMYAGVDSNVYKSSDGTNWVNDKLFASKAKSVGIFNGKPYALISLENSAGEDSGIEAWVRDSSTTNDHGNCNDNDNDGYYLYDSTKCPDLDISRTDCDDNNKNAYPGASETCGNDVDEDCNGIKEQCTQCSDEDNDGYCIDKDPKDCNDKDPAIHPNSVENCNDDIDQNCNGKYDDCAICRENEEIVCIGQLSNMEDKTCSYKTTCNKEGQFGSCIKQDSNCQEHGSCLEEQQLSCPRQLGVCAGSKQKCGDDLKWPGCDYSKIEGYSSAEICDDNLDNDCDGSIDEGCLCYGALDMPCGSLVGECGKPPFGKQTCKDDKWSLCNGHRIPRPEIADSKDNDCDGSVDEWIGCGNKYADGFKRTCGEYNAGECSYGIQQCSKDIDDALKFTECTGNALQGFELCQDDLDNDCDGSVNEYCGCSENEERECGYSDEGNCIKGRQQCSNNIIGICEGAVLPSAEKCDGYDNDCDGTIDEECPCMDSEDNNLTFRECPLQLGVCKGMNQTCSNGQFEACNYSSNLLYQENKETKCDDLFDNDCDGKKDSEDSDCIMHEVKCSDDTLNGKCSKAKPSYCANGILESRCILCGCSSSNEICSLTGACKVKTCGNGNCDSGETKTTCPNDCSIRISAEDMDSDDDTLTDSEEATKGTNPLSKDTDSDGIYDAEDEMSLCNPDGICESEKEYAEDEANCPDDCIIKESRCLIWPALAILLISLIIIYLAYNDNKKLILDKKEIKKLEKLNDPSIKSKRNNLESNNRKFKKKLIAAIIFMTLGIFLAILHISMEKPLLPCSINIALAAVVILAFAAYMLYMHSKNKGKKQEPTANITRPILEIKKDMESHKNVEQLEQYVNTALERGVKEENIRASCLDVGWDNSEINNALRKARTRNDANKFNELNEYIKKSLKANVKEDAIKQKLLKAGWKKEIIYSEFAKIKR